MRYKSVIATTHIDRHFCKISKEALENAAQQIKHGEAVPCMSLEHDSMIPPIGKVLDAWIEEMDDGEYRMVVTQEIFDDYKELILPDETVVYEESLPDDKRPFNIRGNKVASDKLRIETDFVNFESKKEYEEFIKEIKEIGDIDEGFIGRKSLIPDPEVIVTLTKSLIVLFASKPVAERVSNKIIDSIIDDAPKLYEIVKRAIFSAAKYAIPKNRPITYIFEAPGEITSEFIARTSNPNKVITALTQEKLKGCFIKAEELNKVISINKIQFILNENGDWEFNFILTKTGSVIGTPESHNRRARRLKLMQEMKENNKDVL
ncbi:MAG: hypothetical protein ACOWWO_18665 [Peptococcaceae bacterium]